MRRNGVSFDPRTHFSFFNEIRFEQKLSDMLKLLDRDVLRENREMIIWEFNLLIRTQNKLCEKFEFYISMLQDEEMRKKFLAMIGHERLIERLFLAAHNCLIASQDIVELINEIPGKIFRKKTSDDFLWSMLKKENSKKKAGLAQPSRLLTKAEFDKIFFGEKSKPPKDKYLSCRKDIAGEYGISTCCIHKICICKRSKPPFINSCQPHDKSNLLLP